MSRTVPYERTSDGERPHAGAGAETSESLSSRHPATDGVFAYVVRTSVLTHRATGREPERLCGRTVRAWPAQEFRESIVRPYGGIQRRMS